MNRRTATLFAAIGLAVAVGLVSAGLILTRPAQTAALPSPSPAPTPSPIPAATPVPSASPSASPSPAPTPTPDSLTADLSGVLVSKELAHRLPIAVIIDDNRIARPQSGFNGAAIVYQAPADGGETRYLFIFQERDSRDVGPVRSGRIYLAEWASEVRAAIGHYGGDRKIGRAHV